MGRITAELPQEALQNIRDFIHSRMRLGINTFVPSAAAQSLFSRSVHRLLLQRISTKKLLSLGEDVFWWWSLRYVWSEYDFMQPGKPITERALYSALVDLNVPKQKIVKRDGNTFVELRNIDFVYRTHRDAEGIPALGISPHRKGFKFNECPHDFIEPSGYVYELALHMLAVDKWIPTIKEAGRQAYQDALLEQKVRDIKCQMAGAFLEEYFDGTIPQTVEEYQITDSTPGEMDLIHICLKDDKKPSWERPTIEIPLNFREILQQESVRELTEDLGLALGCAEMYKG